MHDPLFSSEEQLVNAIRIAALALLLLLAAFYMVVRSEQQNPIPESPKIRLTTT